MLTSLKLDKVILSSLFESYKNNQTTTVDVVVSGLVPAGGKEFSATVALERSGNRADVYHTNTSYVGRRNTNSGVPVTITGSGGSSVIEYSGTSLKVGVYAYTGASHTPTTQTFTFTIVEYTAPISGL
jgi:hypothetical protein